LWVVVVVKYCGIFSWCWMEKTFFPFSFTFRPMTSYFAREWRVGACDWQGRKKFCLENVSLNTYFSLLQGPTHVYSFVVATIKSPH
jgi:hypothetical protein